MKILQSQDIIVIFNVVKFKSELIPSVILLIWTELYSNKCGLRELHP